MLGQFNPANRTKNTKSDEKPKASLFVFSLLPVRQLTTCHCSHLLLNERRVPELIPVLGSQPAGDVSHKPGGRLPLLSARPAATPSTQQNW